jgi:hypothetical protein
MICTCPACQKDMEAPDEALGRRIRCPYCREVFPARLAAADVVEPDEQPNAPSDVEILEEYSEQSPMGLTDQVDPLDQLAATVDPNGQSDWSFLGTVVEAEPQPAGPPRRPEPSPEGKGWFVLTETDYQPEPLSTQQVLHEHSNGELDDQTQLFHARSGAIVPAGKLVAAVNKRLAEAKAKKEEARRRRAAAKATAAPAEQAETEQVPSEQPEAEEESDALAALRNALDDPESRKD